MNATNYFNYKTVEKDTQSDNLPVSQVCFACLRSAPLLVYAFGNKTFFLRRARRRSCSPKLKQLQGFSIAGCSQKEIHRTLWLLLC